MTRPFDAARPAGLRRWLRAPMGALRIAGLACAALAAIGVLLPPAALAQGSDVLRIGSKRFPESYILAEVLAQTAATQTAVPPEVKAGLGNTAIVYQALRSGAIDLYPEYTGTISLEILKNPKPMSMAELNRALAPLGLGVAIPLGFNDGYALAMRADEAERLGIRSLSDLAKHPSLKFGLSNEFIGRADGWQGLAERYGFTQKPTGLDHGLAYEALERKQIDVTDIYTTDAKIAQLGLRVLDDDRHYFPSYDAVVLYRQDVPRRFAKAWAALQTLAGSIDAQQMIAMNARAALHGVAFDVIARDFLASRARESSVGATGAAAGATAAKPAPAAEDRGFWAKLFGPDLWRLTWQHLALVIVSVAVALLIGVPLAVFAFARPRLRALVLGAAGLLQTVPSLALLAVLISLLKVIGAVPALIALMLYALLPIMRNTDAGLASVSPGLRLAGQALGMTRRQRLRLVELPLALPTLVAGVRVATSITIGTATIAAFIGAGGYGERIVTGLALNDNQLLLAGAIPAIVLALLSEVLFEFIERLMR